MQLTFPAMARSTYASTYISVWTPRSFRSDSQSIAPTVFGMPPIPSCRHAPFGICSTISFATARSTSSAAALGWMPIGSLRPSTIMSTSLMWMALSNPPRQRGMFLLTSTITTFAISHTAITCEADRPKLKYPCLSIGATWNMATSGGVMWS